MSREYRGHVRALKVYNGGKSVGIKLDPNQALDLAIYLLQATKDKTAIDITAHTSQEKRFKDGTFNTTVTFIKQ
jgi:hypothetical protein